MTIVLIGFIEIAGIDIVGQCRVVQEMLAEMRLHRPHESLARRGIGAAVDAVVHKAVSRFTEEDGERRMAGRKLVEQVVERMAAIGFDTGCKTTDV